MTRTITFATSSKGKVSWLERALATVGLHDVRVDMKSMELVEIQNWELAEISLNKARQAYEQTTSPVLVMDGGLYIEELNGFPGPFGSFMIEHMGVENMARMAQGMKNRTCAFRNVVTYMDGPDSYQQFNDTSGDLYTLATEAWPVDHPQQWSPIWRVMIPSGLGFNKPLAAFSQNDLHEYDQKLALLNENLSALTLFARSLAAVPIKKFGT